MPIYASSSSPQDWESLGLGYCPNVGDNGVHGKISIPFPTPSPSLTLSHVMLITCIMASNCIGDYLPVSLSSLPAFSQINN